MGRWLGEHTHCDPREPERDCRPNRNEREFFVCPTRQQHWKLFTFGCLCAPPLIRRLEVVEWDHLPTERRECWTVGKGLVYKEVEYAKLDLTYTFSFNKLRPRRVDTMTGPIRRVVH